METVLTNLTNWGLYPRTNAELTFPDDREEMIDYVQSTSTLIARGNGRCYGDAALGKRVVSTLRLNRILAFDHESGVISCESGVLLRDILKLIVPAGWFFAVTPGIKDITVGGAIASDVHGKNHLVNGCFSHWLDSFELLGASGEVMRCSRDEHTELFWQTCGGMGWTGVILSARFHLMPIASVNMEQMALRAGKLEDLLQAFQDHHEWPYAAAWLDCLASGSHFGRGVVYFARHQTEPDQQPLVYEVPKVSNVPFFAPPWLLNVWTIRAHNSILFSRAHTGVTTVPIDRYFYPLDRIRNWNRLYGRRGFVQYQFCLPETSAAEGIRALLALIQASKDMPFLSVLKRHGDRPAEAVHSFPFKGFSLALDFPRSRTIFSLIQKLDEMVWNLGGRIYLTKDACSAARMSGLDPAGFGDVKFTSQMRERLQADQY